MNNQPVIYTGSIPQCPFCKIPTTRIEGMSTSTCMYFPEIYDENGVNINPDKNTITRDYTCKACNKEYQVYGSNLLGYKYKTA